MKWLITGGCGFVGTNLANSLLKSGDEVIILDNLSRVGAHDNLAWLREGHGTDWRFVEEDIRNAEGVANLVKELRPDALAHLAGQVAMTTSLQNPRLDFEINTLGSLNVLEAVRLNSPETVVLYSSTNKVYGDLAWVRYEETATRYVAPDFPNGFDESIPLDFHSPYGCSKGAADQYMLDYARMYGLRTVVFRHSSMYGGRQFSTYDQGWIGWFCLKALEQATSSASEVTISGNGMQVRDVLYSNDLVQLYQRVAKCADVPSGQVFNIGGGMENSLSLRELFSIIHRITGHQIRFKQLPWRESDQRIFVANYGKAKGMISWTPCKDKVAGIEAMLEWTQFRLSERARP